MRLRLLHRFFSVLVLVGMPVATAVACGTFTNSPPDGGGPCAPGQQITCACVGGGQGAQVCKDDGSYGACECGEGGIVEGGQDAPADVLGADVAHDAVGDVVAEGPSDGGSCGPAADAGPGGALSWAKNFGTTGYTTANAVAIDPTNGGVVVAGYFGGTVNFGSGLLTSHGDATAGDDTFVALFDKNGGYAWAKDFGDGLLVGAYGVAIDASGNVAIGGVFQGSVTFGGSTHTQVGNIDVFVAELDSAGTYLWSKSFGSPGNFQQINTVAVDGAGDVLIAGTGESVDFGGGAETGYFIARFDSTGAYKWSNAFAATTSQTGPWLAVDASGNMILAGSFNATVDFGGGTLTSAGSADAFVAKFDPAGAYQWAKQYGDSSEQDISKVATDANGNIVVTGDFSGTINFGTGVLTATTMGGNDFLAKVNPTGSGVWADEFSGSASGFLNAGSVAVDGCGGATITSDFSGTVDYGGGVLSSEGSGSAAIASFDASGHYRWAYAGGPPSTASESSVAYGMAVASSATSVVVAGGFGTCAATGCTTSPPGSTLVLAGKTLTAVSVQDLFVASFAP